MADERKDSKKSQFDDIPIIWVIGGPGSGKSTQCEMLKMHTQYIHVSSGEALREEIASGSSRGVAIYNLMYNGEPVPNNIMTGVLRETMLSKIMQKGFDVKGFIMDGYPMNSGQAAVFLQFIGPPTTVLYLKVPDSTMNQRLKERYNFDDEQNSIYNRIDNFNKNTLPLVRKWNGITIDAEQEATKVFEDCKKALESEKAFNEIPLADIN